MASYYEMLDVPTTASVDAIKRAFRREIAKYHPDKVQHLGREFQEIAAAKAADLTLAYKTLTDESLRADYDAELQAGVPPPSRPAAPPPGRPDPPPRPPSPHPADHGARATAGPTAASTAGPTAGRTGPAFSRDRAGVSDLVRKAAVMRFRQALHQEFGPCEEPPGQGFDVACAPAKAGFLSRNLPPRIVGRFVAQVDATAVEESWAMAARVRKEDQRDICVFIMGPAVAPAGELGHAISEQRRKPMAGAAKLVVVPINTRTWAAHVPTDAPPQVKALLARLQSG